MDDNQQATDINDTPDGRESEGYCLSIEFVFDESTDILSAIVCDSETSQVIDIAHINSLISDGDWTSLYFRDGALDDLVTKIETGEHGSFEVAQRLDATVSIDVAEDLMSATISSTKPYGGAEMNQGVFETCIASAGIDSDLCDESTVREVLEGKVVVDRVLAAGVEPEQGADAYFEPLVEGIVRRAPRSDEIGNVDQYDLTDFVVEAGAELMRRHPQTLGVSGSTVTGVSIPATPGADVPFFSDLVAAVISDTDPNVLIAEIKGHPIATSNSVRVDPMLKVKDVDLRSGNIEFDGSVEIAGDVRSGVTIDATGDVFVKGVVEAATIIAGNDLLIASGIFKQGDDKSDGEATTRLTAGGQ
ncbi:MAG: DUF342 domain-containing protein [Pseudomonadales bacterium]|nr:DUF342 domain-containing protein [Pseudomonadales bacterium]